MRYIQDDIATVVNRLRTVVGGSPYYMYGTRTYVSAKLSSKDKSIIARYQKYPLIALRFDPEEDVVAVKQYSLNIIIAGLTKPTYTNDERYANVIKPILVPLYEGFLQAIRDSGLFMWDLNEGFNGWPPHQKIDRPYWGADGLEDNEINVFNDPLDAIEIKDLRINSTNKIC